MRPSRSPALVGSLLLGAVAAAAILPGCEQVLGVDFSAYHTQPCSPLQSNCPKDWVCLFDTTRRTFACSPPVGGEQQDYGCSAETDCAPGLACSSFRNNEYSHCTKYCVSDGDCPAGRKCYDFNNPRNLPGGGTAGACGPLDTPCDPLASPSSCAPARCLLLDTDYAVCVGKAEERGAGQACDNQNQCTESTNCIGSTNGGYFCRQVCRVGDTGCPGDPCKGFDPKLKLGDVEYGYCP